MWLAAPLWLMGLIPWGALAVWVMRGRGEEKGVPFLALWRDENAPRPARRRFRLPPLGAMAVLGAILLGLLAAAGPRVRSNGAGSLRIIVDRGIGMSARGENKE